MYERALAIYEKSYGKDHPGVATSLNNLAALYNATNRYDQAEPLYQRALEIVVKFTRSTGHQHPNLIDAVNNYGELLLKLGNTQEQVITKLRDITSELFVKQKSSTQEDIISRKVDDINTRIFLLCCFG